jgi:hypothetical protein
MSTSDFDLKSLTDFNTDTLITYRDPTENLCHLPIKSPSLNQKAFCYSLNLLGFTELVELSDKDHVNFNRNEGRIFVADAAKMQQAKLNGNFKTKVAQQQFFA